MEEAEELLITFSLWENDGDVAPGEAGRTGRLLAPDGRYEYMPLRLALVEAADVEQLAAAPGRVDGGRLAGR
ncbi:hypothetical protein [Streptosporangium sp. NPDC049644]|uniref:hypothetical protein n=1 Tax=Streptosporangium sp. NPDC049644 TaxID=3155507 RepID=UPI00341C22CC